MYGVRYGWSKGIHELPSFRILKAELWKLAGVFNAAREWVWVPDGTHTFQREGSEGRGWKTGRGGGLKTSCQLLHSPVTFAPNPFPHLLSASSSPTHTHTHTHTRTRIHTHPHQLTARTHTRNHTRTHSLGTLLPSSQQHSALFAQR